MPNPLDDAKVYTLADLKVWETLRPGLPPSLAVLGHPVAHSVSPQMLNAALKELSKRHKKFENWRYFKFDIEPERLSESLALFYEKSFEGINLTIPHKIPAVALVKKISNAAKQVGAVNTLIRTKDGGWDGENTDSYGLDMAVKESLGLKVIPMHVVVLGAGGAARSAALQCLREWGQDVWIGARDPVKLNIFMDELKSQEHVHGKRVHGFNLNSPPIEQWNDGVLVINATSVGMKISDPTPFDVSNLPRDSYVVDMIYRRDGSTSLVKVAKERHLLATDGLSMLIWQGFKSLGEWTGISPSAEIMMAAACAALGLPPRHA